MRKTKEYQEQLRSILIQLDINGEIEVKPFFGGAAAYTNGRIFLSLTKVGFAIKLSVTDRDILLQVDGTKKLQYFPKAPIKKDYVVVPDTMLNDSNNLRQWITKSLDYVSTSS